MKVLHIVPRLFGPGGLVGGAERYAFELARAMAPSVPTRLVGFGPSFQSRREASLQVFALRNHLPARKFLASPAGFGLLRHFLWADVIHCHQIYTMATSAALLYRRLTGKPIFLTDHAGGGFSLDNRFRLEPAATARLWVSRLAQAASRYPPIPADAIIYGGVNTERFVPAPPPPPSAPILFVGRVLRPKGVHNLIAAAGTDLAIAIVGPTPDPVYLAELHALAQGKNITWCPSLDGAELTHAYQQAGCLVLPGRETLGLTALEAMACARPVVSTLACGVSELLPQSGAGWSVPPDDPVALRQRLLWLLAHAAEAQAAGRAGRAFVERELTWSAVARRCLVAYNDAYACAQPRHRPANRLGATQDPPSP